MTPHIFIVGPTASGKSGFSHQASLDLDLEILNTDSLLFYKDLNIGTAKPSKKELSEVTHHMIDICDIGEDLNASDYSAQAEVVLQTNSKPLLCVGGSGFYITALNKGLLPLPETKTEIIEKVNKIEDPYDELKKVDAKTAEKVSPQDLYRVKRALQVYHQTGKPLSVWKDENELKPRAKKIGFYLNTRDEHLKIVKKRTEQMISAGLIDEVKEVVSAERSENWRPLKSVGYLQTLQYLNGELSSLDQLKEAIVTKTMQLAKRQKTWFRRDKDIYWYHPSEYKKALEQTKELLFQDDGWKV